MARNQRDEAHKLSIWIENHGLTYDQAATKLGVSKRSISRWITEGNTPDIDVAQRVYDQTEGRIGLMDWPTAYTEEKKVQEAAALRKGPPKAGKRRRTRR